MSRTIAGRIAAARLRLDRATDAIYAAAHPRRDVVFSECRRMAAPDMVEAYESAYSAVREAEDSAIAKGRGYRGTFGQYVERVGR